MTVQAAGRLGITLEKYQSLVDQGLKWCTRCKEWHPRETFRRDSSRFDGLAANCSKSARASYEENRETILEQRREYYKANRDEILTARHEWYLDEDNKETVRQRNSERYQRDMEKMKTRAAARSRDMKIKLVLLKGGSCVRPGCGYNEHPAALQFHHRDPTTKLFSMFRAVRNPSKYSWDDILSELDKCDLLCANCHFIVGCTWVLDNDIWPQEGTHIK